MRLQVEAWAYRIIDCVKEGTRVEDDYVELKRKLVPPDKAARQIAAHANTARGEYILWLVGVDENDGLVGLEAGADVTGWWQQVESSFDQEAPHLEHHLLLSAVQPPVLALLIATDRYPFVIKNPTGEGQIEREVPWRDGARTRSAHRDEIVRLVVRPELEPRFEVRDANLRVGADWNDAKRLAWSFRAQIYAKVSIEKPLTFPNHDASVSLHFSNSRSELVMNQLSLAAPYTLPTVSGPGKRLSRTVDSTPDELIIWGSGKFVVNAYLRSEPGVLALVGDRVDFRITLREVFQQTAYQLDAPLLSDPVSEGDKVTHSAWSTHPSRPST